MHNKDNMLEGLSKKRNLTTLTRRPLSEMEMVDLMIYGEDVIPSKVNHRTALSLANNNLRKKNG